MNRSGNEGRFYIYIYIYILKGGLAMRRMLLFLSAVCLMGLLPVLAGAEMTVHFLDVGHGDCAIVQCDGETMVIDGGSSGQSQLIFAYLTELGVEHVEAVVATHPDADHVGGLPAVFHQSTVGVLYTPVLEEENARFQMLLETAAEKGVEVETLHAGQSFPLGEARVEALWPLEPLDTDTNDASIVLRVSYGETAVLFCADAGNKVERALVDSGAELHANVMKVSHHGSDSATLMQFVLAVSPEYAVISGNERYDNPDDETVLKLLYGGAHLVHTLQNGHIVVTSDGESVAVTSEHYYVANINTMHYHRPTCRYIDRMKENHRRLLFTREEAVFLQMDDCDHCAP